MPASGYIDLGAIRRKIGMGQAEFADRLGVSIRTVQSCEQGWRNPGAAVERGALLLLLLHHHGPGLTRLACWRTMGCSAQERATCVVHETSQGHLCWLLSGHICRGVGLHSWADKKRHCLDCLFFRELFPDGVPTR